MRAQESVSAVCLYCRFHI